LYVPLSGEIKLLNNYIGLEKLRYDERLKVNFSCDVKQDIEIAPLILLSIVENAFKHGAGNEIGEPVINIKLQADNHNFNFVVANSFYPKETETPSSIGLPNLKKQLELIYPQKHHLTISQTENYFIVNLSINLS
jgi:LytS/YehU family sensor histidine kinase